MVVVYPSIFGVIAYIFQYDVKKYKHSYSG